MIINEHPTKKGYYWITKKDNMLSKFEFQCLVKYLRDNFDKKYLDKNFRGTPTYCYCASIKEIETKVQEYMKMIGK